MLIRMYLDRNVNDRQYILFDTTSSQDTDATLSIPIPSLPQRNYLSKIDLEPPSGGLLHIFDNFAWSLLTLSPSPKSANRNHFLCHKSCTHCKRLKVRSVTLTN
jgi:hypothetical protein